MSIRLIANSGVTMALAAGVSLLFIGEVAEAKSKGKATAGQSARSATAPPKSKQQSPRKGQLNTGGVNPNAIARDRALSN